MRLIAYRDLNPQRGVGQLRQTIKEGKRIHADHINDNKKVSTELERGMGVTVTSLTLSKEKMASPTESEGREALNQGTTSMVSSPTTASLIPSQRQCVCVCVYLSVCVRESVCVYACVCERERE